MHLVEELEELAVAYLRGVEGYLQGFGIWNMSMLALSASRNQMNAIHTTSTSRAHGAIARAFGIATNISYSRII